jgi:hypothetical protein
VRPACVQQGNGEQPHRGRPSRWVETVDLVKVVTAAIAEGFVKDGPVPHRRGVIRRHLARADLGGITIEGL